MSCFIKTSVLIYFFIIISGCSYSNDLSDANRISKGNDNDRIKHFYESRRLDFNLKPVKVKADKNGVFVGKIITEWLTGEEKDQKMRLLDEFSFIDYNYLKWKVPKGWVVDGASIPKVLWSIVGSPFVGNYRNASVVHDYYCDVKTAPWRSVHRMFYDASLASGVDPVKAKIMYIAVYLGGPRWEEKEDAPKGFPVMGFLPRPVVFNSWIPNFDRQRYQELSKWIEDENPSIDEIQNLINKYPASNDY